MGPDGDNLRSDVAKAETFLDRVGYLDLSRTDGPTDYYGTRVDRAVRTFQANQGLKIDGVIRPLGPTIDSLGKALVSRPAALTSRDNHGEPFITRMPSTSLKADEPSRFYRGRYWRRLLVR